MNHRMPLRKGIEKISAEDRNRIPDLHKPGKFRETESKSKLLNQAVARILTFEVAVWTH